MSSTTRYLLGFLAAVFAVALRVWLTPLLADRTLYITIFVPVMFAARYLGTGPALLTVATSLLGIWFWIFSGQSSLDRSEISGVVAFLLFSGIIIAFAEA